MLTRRSVDGLSFPFVSHPISDHQHGNTPFFRAMPTSKVQCRGCEKWFQPSGLSQHLAKTKEARCRDSLNVSQVPRMPSSTPNTATPLSLSSNRAPPVSTGRSPDHEYDYTRHGQLPDAEIAATRGAHYLFSLQMPCLNCSRDYRC